MHRLLRRSRLRYYRWQRWAALRRLRRRALRVGPHHPGRVRYEGLDLRYTDLQSLYIECKDIFGHRIYHFNCQTQRPRIIDGGGCLGISCLYFKSIYPKARITCFEPDERMSSLLRKNLRLNGASDVEVVTAGLAARAGRQAFDPDGSDGGRLTVNTTTTNTDPPYSPPRPSVRTIPLSEYLDEPVDLLKLNIEGQEWPVLSEAAGSGKLKNVRRMVIEYHGWPDRKQCLGKILELLNDRGFHYKLHDFDRETCEATKPPFTESTNQSWFCLIHAFRPDGVGAARPATIRDAT